VTIDGTRSPAIVEERLKDRRMLALQCRLPPSVASPRLHDTSLAMSISII
jgi:hypothetical protein